jgi:predicted 2-oxoglutarate/Fe(II)-dependent dioxygenase YbiX
MRYWKWEKSIPTEVCDVVLSEMSGVNKKQASVTSEHRIDEQIRNNKIYFLKQHHWFEGVLMQYLQRANKSAKWNYDITGCQRLQYAEYDVGEKYEWHRDQYDGVSISRIPRKLTVVCQLSDSSEFTGGGLFLTDESKSLLHEKGDVVVFPSNLLHKAGMVDSGVRKTMVGWAY